jgi:hypothetical protein
MAARIASSLRRRSALLIWPIGLSVICGVDSGGDAFGAFGFDRESCSLGLLPASDLADEGSADGGGCRPHVAVAGVVGGLRVAGAHPDQWSAAVGAAGLAGPVLLRPSPRISP